MKYTEHTKYRKNTLMTYLETHRDIPFSEMPFNEADALLLCQMTYPRLECAAETECVTWEDLNRPEYQESLFGDSIYGVMYRDLFHLILNSRRYGEIRICHAKRLWDPDRVIQFGAATFLIEKDLSMVVFRGTDGSLTGWRDDFAYCYKKQWPSHELASAYLNEMAETIPGQLLVGGHSKGGNLAVHASASVPQEIRDRISQVYSFEGMGFRTGFYRTEGYQDIADRVFKIVPEQSVIGMLFVPEKGYRIVKSFDHGFQQHDLMNWKIEGETFVLTDDFDGKVKRKINHFNRWIASLNSKQRERFIDRLFYVLGKEGEDDEQSAEDLGSDGPLLLKVMKKLRTLPKEERRDFYLGVKKYLKPGTGAKCTCKTA